MVETLTATKGVVAVLGADLALGAVTTLLAAVAVASLLLLLAWAATALATTSLAVLASLDLPAARSTAVAIRVMCNGVGGGVDVTRGACCSRQSSVPKLLRLTASSRVVREATSGSYSGPRPASM
jgi:hypothetical protein